MIVLICGGREYDDRESIIRRIAQLPPESIVITGAARGTDTLAMQEAIAHGFHSASVPALWNRYGKMAGHLRNEAMLRLGPELVIAFPGGPGTRNCCHQAEALGIPVERISPQKKAPPR